MCIFTFSCVYAALNVVQPTSIICHQYLKYFANRSADNQQIWSWLALWGVQKRENDVEMYKNRCRMDNAGLNTMKIFLQYSGGDFVTCLITWMNWSWTVWVSKKILVHIENFFADSKTSLKPYNQNCFNKLSSKWTRISEFSIFTCR